VTSKFAKKSTLSNLNETWYDAIGRWDIHDDMTFKVIRGQVKVRRWPQSPIGTILFCFSSSFPSPYCLCSLPHLFHNFFHFLLSFPALSFLLWHSVHFCEINLEQLLVLVHNLIITSPAGGIQSILMNMSVYLPIYIKNHNAKLYQIYCEMYMLHMALAQSFFGSIAIHYVLPVLWITSCFRMVLWHIIHIPEQW